LTLCRLWRSMNEWRKTSTHFNLGTSRPREHQVRWGRFVYQKNHLSLAEFEPQFILRSIHILFTIPPELIRLSFNRALSTKLKYKPLHRLFCFYFSLKQFSLTWGNLKLKSKFSGMLAISSLKFYRNFEGAYWLHLQGLITLPCGQILKAEAIRSPRSVSCYLPFGTP